MIQQIRAGLPQVFIVCEALHGATATDTSRAPYNTTIQAQVTALADRRIVYDTSITTTSIGPLDGDGSIHFNAAGSLDVAQILAAAFQDSCRGNRRRSEIPPIRIPKSAIPNGYSLPAV